MKVTRNNQLGIRLADQSGQSLVMVLVAIGLLGIVVTALTSLITFSLMGQKDLEQRSSASSLQSKIYDDLQNSKACLNTFGGATAFSSPATSMAVAAIQDADGNNAFEEYDVSGKVYENGNLQIKSIELTNYNPTSAVFYGEGTAQINIFYTKNIFSIGSSQFSRTIRLAMTLDTNQKISACHVTGAPSDPLYWYETSATDGIYYNVNKLGVGTLSPNSSLQLTGSLSVNVVSQSANYAVTPSDFVILANANAGNLTITLPTAVGGVGRRYAVKKVDGSANSVNVATTNGQTIDGVNAKTLSAQYQFVEVFSDGLNWATAQGF